MNGLPPPLLDLVAGRASPISLSVTHEIDHPLFYVNDSFCTLTGYGRDDCLGRNCRFLQDGSVTADQRRVMRDTIARGERLDIFIENVRKDGARFWNHLIVDRLRLNDEQDYLVGFQFAVNRSPFDELEQPDEASRYIASTARDAIMNSRRLQAASHRNRCDMTLKAAANALQAWARNR